MRQVTSLNYHMDNGLRLVIKSIVHNVRNDWDSVILISGTGLVRVGKSVLAQQVGFYAATLLNTIWNTSNIVFSGEELISKAKTYPKNSVFVYDEARGELDSKKVLEAITKALMDFFSECGMYNHVVIIVLPDYFDLPKGIAINRSELLLNVYRDRKEITDEEGDTIIEFKRGYFQGFHRESKKKLYMQGKKNFNNYAAARRDFYGEFPNVFTVDRAEYDARKLEYLARNRTPDIEKNRFDAALVVICKYTSALQAEKDLATLGIKLSNDTIMRRIKNYQGID